MPAGNYSDPDDPDDIDEEAKAAREWQESKRIAAGQQRAEWNRMSSWRREEKPAAKPRPSLSGAEMQELLVECKSGPVSKLPVADEPAPPASEASQPDLRSIVGGVLDVLEAPASGGALPARSIEQARMEDEISAAKAAKHEAGWQAQLARSQAYRNANIRRAELRRQGASHDVIKAAYSDAVKQYSPKRYYSRGIVVLGNLTTVDKDVCWLPFANGPSSYYWRLRFKMAQDSLREALKVNARWTVATRHRIDVTNPRHVPWVFNELGSFKDDEPAARWHLIESIAATIGYEPQPDWQGEQAAFTKAMAKIRDYNRHVLDTNSELHPEVDVEFLCKLIEDADAS